MLKCFLKRFKVDFPPNNLSTDLNGTSLILKFLT